MPNLLNRMMKEELAVLLGGISDCVVVDFQGLTVEEADELRSSLRKNDISMQVVKTSLARLILEELNREGYREMFTGPTAVVSGGKDIIQVTKAVSEFAKKHKKLKVKGGLVENASISTEDVARLSAVPEIPVCLAGIAAGIAAPLQGIMNDLNALFSSIAYAIDGIREKLEKNGENA